MDDRVKPRSDQLKIGRFIVKRWLGAGLQGKVFLAFDPDLERHVAIKWLNPSCGREAVNTQGAYPIEARVVARMAHPNIVPLYEAGTYRGFPFLVFAFVEGTTLRNQPMKAGGMPVKNALPLFRAIVDGMAHAHARGALHLDLSPGNIMIDRAGVPRIMDFGLAKFAGLDTATNDDDDELVGTPRYMSPEHFNGGALTARTDVFSLGLIFFEMLTGHSPVQARSLQELITTIADSELDLSEIDALGLDAALTDLLRGALRNDPQKRFADAVALKQALDEFEASTALGSHSTVEFMLNRMQRKTNFPALSNNLVEINRMTGENAQSSVDDLARVVLRDYAITNKLLKLANSSFYGRAGQGVKTVSEAIRMLGMNVVRTTCNGLSFFSAMQDGNAVLKDALISSFASALIGRHCAMRLGRRELAEEVFICGMFHRLGRSLAIYYFDEEFREIERLVGEQGLTDEAASAMVLGIGYADLGMAVAGRWKFPQAIQESMRATEHGRLAKPAGTQEFQRQVAAFANELCELAARTPADQGVGRMVEFALRFDGLMETTPSGLLELLQSVFEKLAEFAPVLGLELKGSRFTGNVSAFIAAMKEQFSSERDETAVPA